MCDWVKPTDGTEKGYSWRCGSCGRICHYVPTGPRKAKKYCKYNFCPWCGQKMNVEEPNGTDNP